MSFESIWPVVTLVGGWFLGELSGLIKSSRDRRDELRLATYRVLALLDDLDLFLYLCDQMPHDVDKAGSVQKADDVRAQMFARWSNQLKTIEADVDSLTLPVARFDPSLAYRLHESLMTLRSLSKPRLEEGILTDTEIITFNAMRQVVSNALQRDLRKLAEDLARRAGLKTAARVRKLLEKRTGTEGLHRADAVMTNLRNDVATSARNINIQAEQSAAPNAAPPRR